MLLSDFKVLTFDVYGTLIDWEAGMVKSLTPLTDRVTAGLTRNEILEAHAREEFRHEQLTPTMRYPELLSVVYRRLAEGWGVAVDWEECVAYGQSARNWRPVLGWEWPSTRSTRLKTSDPTSRPSAISTT
jgi:FMN phosphatase YigB (HAD superfamily)